MYNSKSIIMIKQIIRKISSPEKKVLIENFFSLSFLQIANYIFPLITLPYLVRVLRPEKYGLIAFAQAFIQYFVILTDYGFNLSATREISINRENKEKISEIFSSVMVIKFCLLLVSFVILNLIVFNFSKFRKDWLLYYLTFGVALGQVLFPVWFFQGIERMKYITFLNITAKLIFTISIFIFIHKTEDYIYVPLMTSLGFITAGISGLWILYKDFSIRFILPKFEHILHQLKEGWYIFISMAFISLYTTSNTFILGLFTNNTIVGYYAAAEKIVRVIIRLFKPVSQVLYPYISKVATESKKKAVKILRKLFFLTLFIFFLIFLLLIIFTKVIIEIILGNNFLASISIIKIMSFLLIVIPLANILANLALLPFKLDKYFSRIYISGGLINIIFLFIFLYIFDLKGEGAALANLITEVALTTMMYLVLRKHNIKICI